MIHFCFSFPLTFEQLLHLIEQSLAGECHGQSVAVDAMQPSLEELLFKGDQEGMANIKSNPQFELSNRNKIPRCFASNKQTSTRLDSLVGYKFESLLDPGEAISATDLVKQRDDLSQTVTKFKFFEIDQSVMKRLTHRARQEQVKLASYFTLILSLAIRDAFEAFGAEHETPAQITYHLMATLRTHLNVDVTNMGFCSAFIPGILNISPELVLKPGQDISEWQTAIWKASNSETISLHSRLKAGEHIEGVKADRLLYEDLQNESVVFENGGCHFAISNLGPVLSSFELTKFKITEFLVQVSMKEQRWSSVMFNGLATVNSQLQWGITYNAKLFGDRVIDLIIERCGQYVTKSIQIPEPSTPGHAP